MANNSYSYRFVVYYLILLGILKFATCLNVTADTPIVLVHGYRSNPGKWNKFKEHLINNSFTNIYTFDYSNTTEKHIVNNSMLLYNYIVDEGIVDKEPIFIGHSMGGLIIRHMISENNVNYTKLVLLATPNYGAKHAHYCLTLKLPYCTNAIRDMRPSSDFIRKLNNKTIDQYTETKLLTYYVDHDEQVSAESAIIKTGLYLAVNHNSTITDKNSSNDHACNNDSLTNKTCETGRKKLIQSFGLGTNHGSIKYGKEVFNNVLNFINGRVNVIDAGPKLKDGDCTFLLQRATVRWELPENAPPKLKMDILSEQRHHFENDLAQSQVIKSLSKGTYQFRFFDPETTTLTKWSSVRFYNKLGRCQTAISNYAKTLTTWS